MQPYGYAGRFLRVDLSTRKVTTEDADDKMIKQYIGGVGFGARFLYRENAGNLHWSDPQNRIIFANGPLSNTVIGGSGTICVITKGPMTGLAGSSQGNGYIGAFLKSCRYDGIVIHGKSEKWSYLVISEDKVELRDASHLMGKDTSETQEAVKKELGKDKGISVYCIGPAAERGVRFSVIVGDGNHVASKNGMGAVMGSKNLKAIVVMRGNFKTRIWDEELLKKLRTELYEGAITYGGGTRHKWGTNGAFSFAHSVGLLPVKNYTTNLFPTHGTMTGEYIRNHFEKMGRSTCFNCGINHNLILKVTEGAYKGHIGEEPEYESFAAFGPQIGQTDAGAVFVLNELADRLGLDINETGWVVGWVMECYEKGILSQKETDGLEMTWGNVDATKKLMHKIAHREGFGELLSQGVKRASESVGGEAGKMAVCTLKGTTPRGHDHRAGWPELLDNCFTNTSTLEATNVVMATPHLMDMPPVQAPFSPWEVPIINAAQNGWGVIEDSLGACKFNLNYPKIATAAFNAVTNEGLSIADMLKIGKRIVNTLRVFNIKNGLTADMEAPSPRYGSAPVDGPAKGMQVGDKWNLIRETYYRAMGWDPRTGKPTPQTLKELGLEDLIPDIGN